jgi:hypothetical protein
MFFTVSLITQIHIRIRDGNRELIFRNAMSGEDVVYTSRYILHFWRSTRIFGCSHFSQEFLVWGSYIRLSNWRRMERERWVQVQLCLLFHEKDLSKQTAGLVDKICGINNVIVGTETFVESIGIINS